MVLAEGHQCDHQHVEIQGEISEKVFSGERAHHHIGFQEETNHPDSVIKRAKLHTKKSLSRLDPCASVLSPINRSQSQDDYRTVLPATSNGGNGPLEIEDGGNGPLEIEGGNGPLEIEDGGNGPLEIEGGNGPLEIEDGGSGPLEIPSADWVVKAFRPIALVSTSSTNTTTINHLLMDPSV
jgi:hypothetical protein